jgi:hypothetical protein
MEHSTEAEFQLGEAVADRETAEQGEVIAVDYEEVLEEYIYVVRFVDGRGESYGDVALKKANQ